MFKYHDQPVGGLIMKQLVACLTLLLLTAGVRAQEKKTTEVPLPTAQEMEKLAKDDPTAFLDNCVRRYVKDVKSYSAIMEKQELIAGKLHSKEVIDVFFKEKPHSVFMGWKEGARSADRALYVEGENNGKLLARPSSKAARFLVPVATRDVDGAEAKESGRYTLAEFGIKKGSDRTLKAWKAAKEASALTVEFLGAKKVKELNDRNCWTLRRVAKKAEDDGIIETTIYVDTENWLQTGSVLKDDKGNLIASYMFRDVKINPEFAKDQFLRAAVAK